MKIALIGYGKMGKEIEKVAVARGHEIVSIIDVDNQDDFNSEAFKSADVAIEFTNPMVAYDNYMKTFAAGVKLVSGSTGWMDKHGDEVKELCTKGGKTLFWSSNFSLGVAIFSAVNKYLAKIMNNFPAYEVSMTETHHIVNSIREGEVFGIHTIRYDSEADSISITHDAKNRKGFALGAVLAAEYTSRHEGLLGMSDLFQF